MLDVTKSNEHDPIWYCSTNGKILGPFSAAQIAIDILACKLNESDLYWCQDLDKWRALNEIPELCQSLVRAQKQRVLEIGRVQQVGSEDLFPLLAYGEIELNPNRLGPFNSELDSNEIYKIKNDLKNIRSESNAFKKRIFKAAALGVGISTILSFYYFQENFIQVSSRPELTTEQNIYYRSLASQSMSKVGPRGAVFNHNKSFFVGSNLPDGAVVNIELEGVPETLVGLFKFSNTYHLKIKSKFANFEGASELPEGDYRLKMSCLTCQNLENHIIHETVISVRQDSYQAYDANLARYHQELRRSALREVEDFRQILQTAMSQFNNFSKSNNIESWMAMNSQLAQELLRLNAKDANNKIFYSEFVKPVEKVILKLQRFGSVSETKKYSEMKDGLEEISNILDHLDDLEKLPLSANGMPRHLRF
jgi:hypothetical protein